MEVYLFIYMWETVAELQDFPYTLLIYCSFKLERLMIYLRKMISCEIMSYSMVTYLIREIKRNADAMNCQKGTAVGRGR